MLDKRVLTTELLILRPLTLEDTADLHIALSDTATTHYWHTPSHTTVAGLLEKISPITYCNGYLLRFGIVV